MGFSIKQDFLNDIDKALVKDFLYKSKWWSNFSGDKTTKRRAFSATYKKEDLP